MTAFARALRNHLDAPENRTCIHVPEWSAVLEGAPVVYSQPFTLVDRAELEDSGVTTLEEYAAEVVLRMLEDADGRRLFDRGDKAVLLAAVDADTMIRIADAITSTLPVTPPANEARAPGNGDAGEQQEVSASAVAGGDER